MGKHPIGELPFLFQIYVMFDRSQDEGELIITARQHVLFEWRSVPAVHIPQAHLCLIYDW